MPDNEDWETLITYLVGEREAADKLKESGLAPWKNYDNSTNETGFTALPGGALYCDGRFEGLGVYCTWWSYDGKNVGISSSKIGFGRVPDAFFSVRCIKNK